MVNIELEQMFATYVECFSSMWRGTSIPEYHVYRNSNWKIYGSVSLSNSGYTTNNSKVNNK